MHVGIGGFQYLQIKIHFKTLILYNGSNVNVLTFIF